MESKLKVKQFVVLRRYNELRVPFTIHAHCTSNEKFAMTGWLRNAEVLVLDQDTHEILLNHNGFRILVELINNKCKNFTYRYAKSARKTEKINA